MDEYHKGKHKLTEISKILFQHFAKFKPPGPCIIIFDGAKCHLDHTIVETAERYEITLYCLHSNTTHELQPMDKAVFRAFEYYWDDEMMKYYTINRDRVITKQRFGAIFSIVWDKTMTPSNIKSGFSSTGNYPFNPEAVPEIAFAPSSVTYHHQDGQENMAVPIEPIANQTDDYSSSTSCMPRKDECVPSTSGMQPKKPPMKDDCSSSTSCMQRKDGCVPSASGMQQKKQPKKASLDTDSSNSDSSFSLHDSSSDENIDPEDDQHDSPEVQNISFKNMLTTPEDAINKNKNPRKPAINSRAQVVTKNLFGSSTRSIADSHNVKANITDDKENLPKQRKLSLTAKKTKTLCGKKKKSVNNESWFCKLCKECRVADMRLCTACGVYVHEDCMGLTAKDKIDHFLCPDCDV